MGFRTLQFKIGTLLDWAVTGQVHLPDFQRDYKWDYERFRDSADVSGQHEAEVARI